MSGAEHMAGGAATLQSQSCKEDEETEDEGEERRVWEKDEDYHLEDAPLVLFTFCPLPTTPD